eukprot:TRINITY_DN168_c0_g1_i1.p1 TRINITY_DN168_c0_g1~~TRINITY_DN168_c0_g1_i1.p1  ORF type:complete len:182 (+),score=134.01 TRINITY_DN168_c0_g1_i1:20-565(+)
MSTTLKLKIIETDFSDFNEEELKNFRESFQKFDLDKNGVLEVFELHQMYENFGETKTNAELVQLIKEADQTSKGGIDYREYLSILLKDKKGLLKGSGFGSFASIVGKKHDESKETGKKANIFEQKMAQQSNDLLKEQEVRKAAEMRKKLAQEEREAAKKEAERKKKVAEGLAKLKQGINTK